MSWIFPAIVATFIGTTYLALSYGYIYHLDRRRYTLYWAGAWGTYSIVLAFAFLSLLKLPGYAWLPVPQNIGAALSGWLVLRGVAVFCGYRLSPGWLVLTAAAAGWAVIGLKLGPGEAIVQTPVFFVIGLLQAWAGISLLRRADVSGTGLYVTSWSLIAWGVHRADYPLLKTISWFAPWGFIIAACLELVVAFGLLLLHFSRTRSELLVAQAELETEERKYRTLIENLTDVVFQCDVEGRISFVTPALEELLGYSPGEIVGRVDFGRLFGDDRAAGEIISQVTERGRVANVYVKARHRDGATIWVAVNAGLNYDHRGRPALINGSVRDVTALVAAEDRLRDRVAADRLVGSISTDLIHRTEDTAGEGIRRALARAAEYITADRGGVVLLEAGGMVEAHSWPGREVLSTDPKFDGCRPADLPWLIEQVGANRTLDLNLPEDLVPADGPTRRLLAGGRDRSMVVLPLAAGGDVLGFIYFGRSTPAGWSDIQGHAMRLAAELIAVVIDRSNRTEKLKESEARYRLISDSMRDLLVVNGPDGVISFVSPSVETMLGYPMDEIVGRRILDHIHPADEPLMSRLTAQLLAGERTEFLVENRLRRRDGQWVWFETLALAISDSEGRVTEIQAINRDITERRKAVAALRESEEKYRQVVETANEGIFIIQDGRYRFVNTYGARLVGCSKEEILDGPLLDFVHPQDRAFLRERLGLRLAGEKISDSCEHRLIDLTGQMRWVQARGVLTSWSGRPANMVFVVDITDRKETQMALQEVEARFATFMDNLPALALIKNEQGEYTYSNSTYQDLLGIKGRDRLGRRVEDIRPDRAEQVNRHDRLVIETGQPVERVEQIKCTDGLVHHFLVNRFPIVQAGRPAGVGTISLDISPIVWVEDELRQAKRELEHRVRERTAELKLTNEELEREIDERRQTEAALRLSESSIRSLVKSASGFAIYRLALKPEGDPPLEAVLVSPSIENLLGVSPEAEFREWFQNLHSEDWPRIERAISEMIETGNFDETIRVYQPQSDEWRWIQVLSTQIVDAAGSPGHINGIMIDVTERKMMEVQLAQMQRLESIGRMAAGIAHEINTPTQYVGSNAYFLWNAFTRLLLVLERQAALVEGLRDGRRSADHVATELDETVRQANLEFFHDEVPKAIQAMIDGVERITKIVKSMKSLAHPGLSEMETVDLNDLVAEAAAVSKNEWKYRARLKTDLDRDLPPINCQPAEIEQVLINLILNAAQAIEERPPAEPDRLGLIEITTRRRNGWAEITVSDSGPGIPEAVLERVFDPFFTTKDIGRGTGLGLSISRSVITDRHGGMMRAANRPQGGAVFMIRLPLGDRPSRGEAAR